MERVISGGQTGADRGGLDAALQLGLPHGGFCPRGRRAEDGRIPARYRLEETESREYADRTLRNVLASDATVLLTRGAPSGGSALTWRLAEQHGRPCLHLDLAALPADEAALQLRAWLAAREVRVLNVAGSRESGAPGLCDEVRRLLVRALS